jgi:exopolysaccharide production protein ExoQ
MQRLANHKTSRWHSVAVGLFLLLATGALDFIDRILYGEWGGKPGDKVTETLNLLAIVVSLLLLWWGTSRLHRPRFNRVLPLMVAGLLVSSVLWSVTPDLTITRSIAYFFTVVGAIGTVETLDTDEVMKFSAFIGALSAAVSLLLYFVHPDAVISEFGGFRGLFSQKNTLGQAMMVGVLGGLHGIRIGNSHRLRYIGVIALCTVVAFLSKSATAMLAIFAFFTFHFIGGLYIKGGGCRLMSLWLTIVGSLCFVLVMMNIDLVFSFLEKDSTLTGRTELWPYVVDAIFEKPMLGWGFTAFWSITNPRAGEISSMVGWSMAIPEAHNGLLEILLDVGVVGVAIFVFLWLRNLIMAVKCMNEAGAAVGVSSLLFLIGILVIGVSEQVLLTAEGPTVQFFLLGFMCEKELWRARQARSGISLRSAGELRLSPFVAPR